MSDNDRRLQLRLLDRAVHAVGDALDVVEGPAGRLAVSGKVEREDAAAGVDPVQLGQYRVPEAAVEGQAVQQDERWSTIGAAGVGAGERRQSLRVDRVRLGGFGIRFLLVHFRQPLACSGRNSFRYDVP